MWMSLIDQIRSLTLVWVGERASRKPAIVSNIAFSEASPQRRGIDGSPPSSLFYFYFFRVLLATELLEIELQPSIQVQSRRKRRVLDAKVQENSEVMRTVFGDRIGQ